MSQIRIKRRVKHSYGCTCDNPYCASVMLGLICSRIGRDIPYVDEFDFFEDIAASNWENAERYIHEHFEQYSITGFLSENRNEVHGGTFALRSSLDLGVDRHGYRLLYPKPGHERFVPAPSKVQPKVNIQ